MKHTPRQREALKFLKNIPYVTGLPLALIRFLYEIILLTRERISLSGISILILPLSDVVDPTRTFVDRAVKDETLPERPGIPPLSVSLLAMATHLSILAGINATQVRPNTRMKAAKK